jgi:hypothetical protein
MAKYVTRPVHVEAVQYEPPTGADAEDGNLAELQSFGDVDVIEQAPWDPANGQNCVHLQRATAEDEPGETYGLGMLKPGDYLVKDADGVLSIADRETFDAKYQPVKPAKSTD